MLLLFCGVSQASDRPLVLQGEERQVLLQPYIAFSIQDRNTSLDEFRQRAIWTGASNRSGLNFGYQQNAVWLKLVVSSNAATTTNWKLHFPYSSLDRVELHHEGDVKLAGDTIPLSQRSQRYRDPVFSLRLAPGEQQTLYFKAYSEGSLTLTAQLWSEESFAQFNESTTAILSLYLGMLLAMVTYNLLLLSALRERAYALYVGFVLAFSLGAMAFTGIGPRYIWPEAGEWSNRILPFALCLSGYIGTQFARTFIDTRRYMPAWHRVTGVAIWAWALLTISSLIIPLHLALKSMSILGMVCAVILMGCLVQAARRNIPGARIFLAAWSMLVTGSLILALRNFGWLPSNVMTTYAMHIGSALEVILLAFALAARLLAFKQQKEAAQASALAAQAQLVATLREHEVELEQRVRERTMELAAANAQLEAMAMQDPLTGLANRTALERHIAHAMRRTRRREDYLAVMLIDLDGFKQINDQLGHETGDAVLRCIADRLKAIAREADFIARLGGDEFVLVAENMLSQDQAHFIAEHFLDTLSMPIDLGKQSVSVGASIGITLTRSAQPDMALLLREADSAMCARKRSGRHGVSFYLEPTG
ncbi:7TM diverse intracellular signaling domain-containing protein [Pseudomonas sp.]|uniref:7TM diverse intracellular signaling domain-containing protein n=1 Tax=Pseudomonas sp. TaxID=306 RepID=UPI00272C4A12|nr:diguanylate cyclase [Pseudomonas sp.]